MQGVNWDALISQGGPFAAALVLLIGVAVVYWRFVGRPHADVQRDITANLATCASEQKQTAALNVSAARENSRAAELCSENLRIAREMQDAYLARLAPPKQG